jgi:hypothetical protein
MWPFQRIAREGDGLRCSFCGKSQNDVRKLIAGPGVYICDACIELCNDILAEERAQLEEEGKPAEAEPRAEPRSRPTGVAVCRLCGLPTPMDHVSMILDRGYLCDVCLDAIREASEPESSDGR